MATAARYLVVRVCGEEFALDGELVRGMTQARGLGLRDVEERGALRWVVQMHGRLVPVYEANRLLGLRSRPLSARSCVVLLGDGTRTDGVPAVALLVDSISRMEMIPSALWRAPEAGGPAQVKLGEKWRDVLDVAALGQGEAAPDFKPGHRGAA